MLMGILLLGMAVGAMGASATLAATGSVLLAVVAYSIVGSACLLASAVPAMLRRDEGSSVLAFDRLPDHAARHILN